jgi:integrase
MKRTLNDRAITALKPAAPGKRYAVMDAIVPGLGVRVTDSGHKSYVLRVRFPGQAHAGWRSLGDVGAITLEHVRGKARGWLEQIAKGVDPQQHQRQEATHRAKNSFAAVAGDYIRRHVAKTRKAAIVERELRREFVARWSTRPITEITQHDVVAVLDEAVERGALYQAHNLFGHVRTLFNWAVARGIYGLDRSPCDRLKPGAVIGRKLARSRTLTDDELRALWRVSGKLGYPFGPMYQMLVLTGQRKSEVAEAGWSEFDLTNKLWTIPAERMKSEEGESAPHVVPLTDDVIAILNELPRFNAGPFLFTTTAGRRPVSGFSKAKARLDRRMLITWRALARLRGEDRRGAMIAPFVNHDIRRTVRSHFSALPVEDLVRELVIGHARPSTLHKVYDHFSYLDERRQCLELWAARLRLIIDPAPNVVKLKSRKTGTK